MSKSVYACLLCAASSLGAYFFTPLTSSAGTAAIVTSPFTYNFSVEGKLNETAFPNESTSPYWWVNSGGRMYLNEGEGKTVQGSLPVTDVWRQLYALTNPLDTDDGYHPQNIFRLVGRSLWHNFRQEAYFTITKDNLSTSPNRNASNGLLLFNRYQDSDNLYYTGLRVDGAAVIKKKQNGRYYTLAYARVSPGTYNALTSPNLLPKHTPIGVRSEVKTVDGKVVIKLYSDISQTGVWELVAQATDDGVKYGPIIDSASFGGLRTDFMDVSFDRYRIENI